MKRLALAAMGIFLAAGFSWAETEGVTPHFAKMGPCKKILTACQAAGFYYGGHAKGPNKGEYLDCLEPVLKGQSVAGVTADPATISACQQARARHAARKSQQTTPPAH